MENCKLYVVEMPENILSKETYKNMQIWLTNIFTSMQDDATLWLGFNYLSYAKVMTLVKEIGFTNHLDNWLITEDENGTRQDYFHLTKKASGYTWNKVEFKREVVVPYMVDGKPRGWFRGPDGRPLRYTGVGNCIYASNVANSKFCNIMFILTSSNEGDLIDLQTKDLNTIFIARALGRKLKGDHETLNDFDPGDKLREEIRNVFGEVTC